MDPGHEADEALMSVLMSVNSLYTEHQLASKLMRKGFMNMVLKLYEMSFDSLIRCPGVHVLTLESSRFL